MKTIYTIVGLCLLVSCSPTSKLVDHHGGVSIATTESLNVKTSVLTAQTKNRIEKQNLVLEKGAYYLEKVVIGYAKQLEGIHFDTSDVNGLHFEVISLNVKKGFTLNLIDPGPVYKMNMKVNIYQFGEKISSETYSTRVNMAYLVNEGKFWNWLTAEEIGNTNNQILTFERGLRNLYRDMYFKHLDISLTL